MVINTTGNIFKVNQTAGIAFGNNYTLQFLKNSEKKTVSQNGLPVQVKIKWPAFMRLLLAICWYFSDTIHGSQGRILKKIRVRRRAEIVTGKEPGI